ncbi:MAG: hypothetical protein B6U97_02125 [Candidatus Altiarchaeales archaeon ex4484_96]|nr:MAG: hypothetical protein B6U97_02125 [Candidatus Altiarchaeales archaeon ex4484_96]
MNEGQVFTSDYIVGVSVFIIVFSACIFFWENTSARSTNNFMLQEMRNTASRTIDHLVEVPGRPSNWEDNPGYAEVVGLSSGYGMVSADKFHALSSMEYGILREYLGVGNYQVYLRLKKTDGLLVDDAGLMPQDAHVVSVRRFCVLDNQSVVLEVLLWDG